MVRLKTYIGVLAALVATPFDTVVGRAINTTIYDTNTAHVSYGPKDEFCIRWVNDWVFWQKCEGWARPWGSEVYRNDGHLVTLHRSINHQLVSMTVEFEGSAVWLYGPPRAQLSTIPRDYKICLSENHRLATDPECYRVDVAKAYFEVGDRDAPVVIFAKGGLRHREYRVIVSVADPIDEAEVYHGIQFSHAVYTIDRPTPWPIEEDHWRFRRVILHDTHPLLSYYPKTSASTCNAQWCQSTSGWAARTYTAEDGTTVSWHELKSQTEYGMAQWGVGATFAAGAVAVYGIPKAHVLSTDRLSHICVQVDSGPCETVDVRHAYLNSEHHHESVLLWRHDALDPSRSTRLSIRLTEANRDLSVFPFKAIHYFESQEYASPGPPVGQSEDVVIPHDNEAILYHPGRRCTRHFGRSCTRWFDPWVWREAGPWEHMLTYRSTVSSYRTTEDPAITMDFQGSAVYVYGAPKSFIKDAYASQQICINDVCHIVDVEQAYLNAPQDPAIQSVGGAEPERPEAQAHEPTEQTNSTTGNITTASVFHPELEPVLIWSMTGLDDQVQHSLRLALAARPSDDNAEMSIAKVVYTRVSYDPGQSRPDTPIPQPYPVYEGPTYPPHASKWSPRAPPPPLPSPSQPPAQHPPAAPPTAPPAVPHPPATPPSPLPSPSDPVAVILTICLVCYLAIRLNSLCTRQAGTEDELQPIRSNPQPPSPPPYYQGQPRPYPYTVPIQPTNNYGSGGDASGSRGGYGGGPSGNTGRNKGSQHQNHFG